MNNIFIGFILSSMKRRHGYPFIVLVCIDSIVVTGFVQHCRCLVELWCRRGYELVSIWFLLCFFRFCLLAFVFVLFHGDEDGWWLCFSSVIWFENHKYGFLDWRYEFFSYDVVLFAYLDSTWLVLSCCCLKWLGA
jgi:hypothetical protein